MILKLTSLSRQSSSFGKLIAALTLFNFAAPASATTLLYEGFDYSGSNLSSANGGSGWSTSWKSDTALTTDSIADIGSGSLSTPTDFTAPIGNHISLANPGGQVLAARGIAAPAHINLGSDNTWYFSFLSRKSTSSQFMNFRQGNSTNVLSLSVSSGGAVTMTLDDQATTSGTLVGSNLSYLYVGKIVGSSTGPASAYFTRYADSQTLPLVEPVSWTLNVSTSGASTLFAERIALYGGSNRTVDYDEIRIGSTWADGVGAIPEPSAFATISGVLALGLALARRRSRA